jgi:hypothetical protein
MWPRDLLLDASGKSLYYSEGSGTRLLVRRVDTDAFNAPQTILDKKRLAQSTLSPDRKTLFVLASEAAARNLVLIRYEAATGKRGKEIAIPRRLSASLHAGADRVVLRGPEGLGLVDAELTRLTVVSPGRNDQGAWLAPKGTRLYVEGFVPHTLNAYDVPAEATALPEAAFTMELQEPVRNATQRGPTISPDGKFLLFSSGRLIALGKDAKPAKPAEPDPEP